MWAGRVPRQWVRSFPILWNKLPSLQTGRCHIVNLVSSTSFNVLLCNAHLPQIKRANMHLVVSVGFQALRLNFYWKKVSSFCKCKSYSQFFSKNTCELDIVLTRTVNILNTIELVTLTMFWTSGPWLLMDHIWYNHDRSLHGICMSHFFISLWSTK